MNNFMFNVKQFKMNEFIKYIWLLIISTSNATLEVLSLRPCISLVNHGNRIQNSYNLLIILLAADGSWPPAGNFSQFLTKVKLAGGG